MNKTVQMIFKATALAMGIVGIILILWGSFAIHTVVLLLAIGLSCLAVVSLLKK